MPSDSALTFGDGMWRVRIVRGHAALTRQYRVTARVVIGAREQKEFQQVVSTVKLKLHHDSCADGAYYS